MKKARLIFTNDCNRNCKGCCNKNWTGELPKEIDFIELVNDFDKIYITGGEPMLYVSKLKDLINRLKRYEKKVYLYTALPYPYSDFLRILEIVDGCTLTLHSRDDYKNFKAFELDKLDYFQYKNKSLRLNVFPKIKINSDIWDVRPKVWIKDAPLPEGEIMVKLKTY